MSKADRHSEALLGIHLAKGQRRAQGSPPSDEELVLLMDGQLGEQRRSEVLSHLAHRPERYRQWLSLADMDSDEQASQTGLLSILSRGINNWLIDWRYAAGGIGAMAAVILVVNQMALPPSQQLRNAESVVEAYAPAPMLEEEAKTPPAKPSADSAADLHNPKRGIAEERRSLAALPPAGAKRLPSAPVRSRCLPATQPATTEAGTLCAVQLQRDEHELRWSPANSDEALPLVTLPHWPLHLQISDNNQWLAVQVPEAIYVFNLPKAFAGEASFSQLPFTAGTARMNWNKNELMISVLQALGDSDDDLVYRYQPETGDIQPPP